MVQIPSFIWALLYTVSLFNTDGLGQYGFKEDTPIKVSYYGHPFHGRLTANGEVFDMEAYTCASPTLPMNTQLTLRCEDRYISVRVNDRGPFEVDSLGMAVQPLRPHPVRKLDLSQASFYRLIGDLEIGIGSVYVVGIRN